MKKDLIDFHFRRRLFESFLKDANLNGKCFTCPSCGFPTLTERHSWEICLICNWEDDGQDDQDADKVYRGPNGEMSLTDSRIEFQKEFGQYLLDENRRLVKDEMQILDAIESLEEDLEKVVDLHSDNEDRIFQEWARLTDLLFESLTEKTPPNKG